MHPLRKSYIYAAPVARAILQLLIAQCYHKLQITPPSSTLERQGGMYDRTTQKTAYWCVVGDYYH